MSLILLTKTSISLPEIKIIDEAIGQNKLLRFGVIKKTVEVKVYEAVEPGWYELQTELSPPYNKLYLKKPNTKKQIQNNVLRLEFVKSCEINKLDETTKLRWINHPSLIDKNKPTDIVASWSGKFRFLEEKPEQGQTGLRLPQIGALHSISAYFSLEKNIEPAIVVLPTGTGKTETMLSLMIYRQLSKILVVVPTNSLRNQIAKKFYGLGCLSQLGAIPADLLLPAVAVIKSGIKSVEEADNLLSHSNVFIATPNILNSSNETAVEKLCSGINDLFIDEAHHSSAKTWVSIKEKFSNKRILQFTATPFRNNGSSLGGKIIYNYTMGEAQRAGYFNHINIIPVEEYFLGAGDKVIAQKAINQLRSDIDNKYDHLLMARVETIERAKELFPIYKHLAPEFKPTIVYSKGMSKVEIEKSLHSLLNRESKIVICVNMLGEGFDLPNLKIAAIHDIHKSLAVTLQFIGRFTRSSKNVGDASVIVNIAEAEVEEGLQHLYAQGSDWDSVLRHLSEGRIDREIKLQEVIESLKEKGNLHEQIPLWNLRPSFSAILFKTNCTTWTPERYSEVLSKDTEHWNAISNDKKLLVVLAVQKAPIKWGNYKDLSDVIYKLLIVHWDKERSALFFFSNDYKWFHVEKLATLIGNETTVLLSGPQVFNIFNGLKYPLVRNLGASQRGAISFTQYFGSNVTEGLDKIESSQSDLSNLAGLGYDNGDRVIWGCSQKKGKIWSVNGGTITDWTSWVKTAWDKVTSGEIDEENITKDFLRPKTITEPHNKYAIAVQWGEHIQADPEDRVMIMFGEVEAPLYLVDLAITSQAKKEPYQISVSCDDHETVYEFTIDNRLASGYAYQKLKGASIFVKRGNNPAKPLEEYLQSDPWIIQYVDGSFSYNRFLIELPTTVGEFSDDQIEFWDWDGINITKESMGKKCKTNTVQWRAFENIKDLYDVVINDDGCGEAADLVGLKIAENEIHLGLIHCKYSKAEIAGARIDDLYDVCGQAQKSIRWKHAGISRLYGHLKGRNEIWSKVGFSRFLKGSMSDLANIKRRSRTAPLKLQVWIVQPGIEKNKLSHDMLRVLGSTSSYLKNTAQTNLIVVGSETA